VPLSTANIKQIPIFSITSGISSAT